MGRTLYAHPTDLVAAEATWTLSSGVTETDYGIDKLTDGQPALGAKFSSAGFRIVGNFGSAQRIDLVALIHPYGDEALEVVLEGNTSDSWPGAISVPLTLPAAAEDGFLSNVWADLSTVEADASARTYQYWSLYFPDGSATPRLGELVLSARKRLLPDGDDLSWGYRTPEAIGVVRHRTAFGTSLRYHTMPRVDRFEGSAMVHDDGLAALRAWRRASRARATLVIPNHDGDEALLAEWAIDELEPEHVEAGAHRVAVAFTELSRGLPWVDPDE